MSQLPPIPPPKLDYSSPPVQGSRSRASWGKFCLGLFGGLGMSLLYYMLLGMDVAGHSAIGPFGAILLKVGVGIGLLFSPRWRSLGIGLICSIPFAILIFFALCFGLIALY
jgi:hypothetical protein